MTTPPGFNPPHNSGFGGAANPGTPTPGFGAPQSSGFGAGFGPSVSSGNAGAQPPFGGGNHPTPVLPEQQQYQAPQPAQGNGRVSGAIIGLIAGMLALVVALGIGAYFLVEAIGDDSGPAGNSAHSLDTAASTTSPQSPADIQAQV